MEIEIIARIHTDFPEKFGIPRQSGLVPELTGTIIFEKKYRNPDALRGICDFSHLWLIWEFSRARRDTWSATVRPPRLGGNTRVGVFATRSPFRPNPLGLSCVKLEKVTEDAELGPVLTVSGVDMLDGTPVYDIKPYLPYADSYPDATEGFAGRVRGKRIAVSIPEEMLRQAARSAVCKINIDSDLRLAMTAGVRQVLHQNPAAFDPREYLKVGRANVKAVVAHKIKEVLGSEGKA